MNVPDITFIVRATVIYGTFIPKPFKNVNTTATTIFIRLWSKTVFY